MIPLNTRHSRNARINSFIWSFFAILLISTFILLSPDPLFAQGANPDAAGLTQALTVQSSRYQQASRSEQASLLKELIETAASRQQQLLSIIEQNPGEVIRLAVPATTRAALPSAVQAYIEQEIDIEGNLEVMYEDYDQHSRLLYHLETAEERFSLHFADHRPEHLLTGAKIRVKGVQVGTTLALAGGDKTVQQVAPAPVLQTLGELRTLVILVNFQDNPTEPYTVAEAQSVMFGTTSNFFLENSYQQTWLSGDVVGWFTIPISSTVCDFYGIAAQALSAASAAGVNLDTYTHHVYAFPQNYACYFWGLSTVGGSPSKSWINGDFELGVTAHELGHGLGLFHSHSTDCGATTLGPSCTAYEYGDTQDMMGASSSAHLNAFQKERLGWLNAGASPAITTVLTDGTYALETYEPAGPGPKALKIPKSTDPSTGKQTWYYVQSRQAIGFDAYLDDNTNVLNGVLIHFGTESNGNSSYLLDMTPESGSSIYYDWHDPALVVGQSFHDPEAGVTMTTEWVTGTEAAVTVRFEAALTVSTDKPTYNRNQTVAIKAMVSSGGWPVANASVTITVTKSNGAVVTGTATTGNNGAAVYKLRLKRQDPIGVYQVRADSTRQVRAATMASALSGSATTRFTVY